MRLVAWGLSDVGMKREHNEDALLINDDLGLFVVADGMGGHSGGDRASRLAVETVEREVSNSDIDGADGERRPGPSPDDPAGVVLAAAARVAGRTIYETAASDPLLSGMGTTLTAMLVHQGRAYFAHVGDSRAYLFRDDRLEQLTVDHTWIEEQVRAGFMTRQEAKQSDLRHIVTRSVGYEEEVRIDLLAMPALMGDCFILCSDGLSNYVDGDQLRGYLNRSYYAEAPRALIDGANKLGGDDNVTVVLVYVANDGGAAAAAVPAASEGSAG